MLRCQMSWCHAHCNMSHACHTLSTYKTNSVECARCHLNIITVRGAPGEWADPGGDNIVTLCGIKKAWHVTRSRAGPHDPWHSSHDEREALSSCPDPLSFVYLSPQNGKRTCYFSYLLPTCRPRPRWAPCCGSGWACCCCSPGPGPRSPLAPYHMSGGARCSTDPRPSGRRSPRQSASCRKPRTRNTAEPDNFIFHILSWPLKKRGDFPPGMRCPWTLNCFNELILCKWAPSTEQQVAVAMKLFVPEDGRFSSEPSWRSHLCWTEAGIYHTCAQTVSHNPENETVLKI